MAISTRRHLLRSRTSSAHAALDETVGTLDTLEQYRRYLRGLLAFREPAERLIADEAPFGLRPTRIAALLHADMTDLGVMPAEPVALAAPVGTSGLIGLVYVLEGSALGARLLRRQAAAIGLDARHGARHLAAQAESLDAWTGFLAVLDGFDAFDEAEAVAAAEAAFAAARAAFTRLDAPENLAIRD
ncbi:MAG: biliverdin-producing heme oxygenase [Amaricoccus sp.]|uniref:biliverdin-producing heme oxygenase n=1 Tax=Amaricoccus sp. TaxID=1872485 RepID=UPI0039E563CB